MAPKTATKTTPAAMKRPLAPGKGKTKASATAKRSTKRRHESFKVYIYKVLKAVHPDLGMSTTAMSVMNSFMTDMFERLAKEASHLVRRNKQKSTMTSHDIMTAVRLVLPGELAKHAVSEGTKAITVISSLKR